MRALNGHFLKIVRQAKRSAAEDAEDVAVFEAREKEADYDFGAVVKDLKRRRKI